MKRVLTTSILVAVFCAGITYGDMVQANNDGTGSFVFNVTTTGSYFQGGPSNYFWAVVDGGKQGEMQRWSGTANTSWTASVNSNNMTIDIQNFSFTASEVFQGALTLTDSTYVIDEPAVPGFGGHPEIGHYEYSIETVNYTYECDWSATSNNTLNLPISNFSPFSFSRGLDGYAAPGTGTLSIDGQTIPFDVPAIHWNASISGTLDDSQYPRVLTMYSSARFDNVSGSPFPFVEASIGDHTISFAPEPATLLLLGLGAAMAARKQK